MYRCMDVEKPCGMIMPTDACIVKIYNKDYKRPKKFENMVEYAWKDALHFVEKEAKKQIETSMKKDILVVMGEFLENHILIDFFIQDSDLSGTAIARYTSEKFYKRIDWYNPETDRDERIKWEHERIYIKSVCVFIEKDIKADNQR